MTRLPTGLVVTAILSTPLVSGQDVSLGKTEHMNSCAQCHGAATTGRVTEFSLFRAAILF